MWWGVSNGAAAPASQLPAGACVWKRPAPCPAPPCSGLGCARGGPAPPRPPSPPRSHSTFAPSFYSPISLDLGSPLLSFSLSFTLSLLFFFLFTKFLPPRDPQLLSVYIYTSVCLAVAVRVSLLPDLSSSPPYSDPGSSVCLCLPVSLALLSPALSPPTLTPSLIFLSLLSRDPAGRSAPRFAGPAGAFLSCPWALILLSVGNESEIRKRGSGGVIGRCTRGSRLISGGPGFERKCSCNTGPFLPSLSCLLQGCGDTGTRLERAWPSALCRRVHTHACAHTLTGMHTQGSLSDPHIPHRHQALHLILALPLQAHPWALAAVTPHQVAALLGTRPRCPAAPFSEHTEGPRYTAPGLAIS